jgi:hypothetical protein
MRIRIDGKFLVNVCCTTMSRYTCNKKWQQDSQNVLCMSKSKDLTADILIP